jgi:hypothetical protein
MIAPDLDDAIARLLKRGAGPGGEVPLPLDVAASEIAAALRGLLGAWTGAHGRDIRAMALALLRRGQWIHQHEQAPALLAELTALLRRAIAVTDRLAERVPAGTCPGCGTPLYAELGADEVRCRCGVLTAGLTAKRRERAAAADVLGDATAISGALAAIGIRVSAGTIRMWASRGRLTQRPGGQHWYAMSDVLVLVAQRDSRAAG